MGSAKPVKNNWYGYTSQNKCIGRIGSKKDLTKEQADQIADEWDKRINPKLPTLFFTEPFT